MRKRPRQAWLRALLLAVGVLALAFLLVERPPRAVVRGVARWFAQPLLAERGCGNGPCTWQVRGAERLVLALGAWVEFHEARRMAARMPVFAGAPDASPAIAYAKRLLVHPECVPFRPPREPLLAGFGWCDQANAAVGRLLSALGWRVDLWALVEPATARSPHTILRVAEGAGDAVYVDAYFNRVSSQPTRAPGDTRVRVLNAVEHCGGTPEPALAANEWPRLSTHGFVLKSLPPVFTLELVGMLARVWNPPPPSGPIAPVPVGMTPSAGPIAPTVVESPNARYPSADVAAQFLAARFADFDGDTATASRQYLAIAARAVPITRQDSALRAVALALACRSGHCPLRPAP